MATSHGWPASDPGDDLRDPGQLRRPAHENVERWLPVLHAPTSLPPTATPRTDGRSATRTNKSVTAALAARHPGACPSAGASRRYGPGSPPGEAN